MTESERLAIAWARQYLRGHHCPECGREWITVASVGVLMHKCRSPQRRSSPLRFGQLVQDREEERRAWAVSVLGPETIPDDDKMRREKGPNPITEALEAAVPEDDRLRRVDDDTKGPTS